MLNKKIRAFTIMELTIAMLLSAIVISATYSSYLIISTSYSVFIKKNTEIAELSNLDHLIRKDFIRSEYIAKDISGLVFSIDGQRIHYQFYPHHIIRTSTTQDTFKFKSAEVNLSFEGSDRNAMLFQKDSLIDALNLKILLQNDSIPYVYHKIYSSVTLLNLNTDALN